MKHSISALFIVIAAITWSGCGEKDATPDPKAATNSSSGNPITAPVDYLGAVAQAKKTADKKIETVSLQSAVQLFQAQEGRLPKDLNELVTQKYLPRIPDAPYNMKIVYDAATGNVAVVPKN